MEAFDRFTCTVQVKESLLLAEDLLEEELEKCLQQWEVGHDDDWDVEDEDDEDDEDASDWEELITDWVRVLLKDVLATATMRIDVKMIENADEDEYENEDHDLHWYLADDSIGFNIRIIGAHIQEHETVRAILSASELFEVIDDDDLMDDEEDDDEGESWKGPSDDGDEEFTWR
ncbi:hypothetical protein A2881_02450 [Candidatus Peribacteria bacterium RIFCSPHIGHO2_01_FULL_55_13]|nr:MAG: hypothetical protein A2881_02450 [Candidatus Peribacteria bacterium RIFCSPHIGHO2_01_FULL_55_13]OGJ64616.1 MAG: hypothetical protein A3F36_01490 [Candidatus Peribacteria bacterium RIFCSPHIGHO2_12_FULL_55_11]